MHKLNEDQLHQVKDCMLEHPGHLIFRKLQNPAFNQGVLDYSHIVKTLVYGLMDVAAKKLPSDLPFSNKQLDQIIQKVKLIPVPKNVVPETTYSPEGAVVQEKNTNERAIVRIRVPKKKVEEEITEVNQATGEETHKKIEKMVEIEHDDKVLLFPSMVSGKDYSIYAFSQNAPRVHRREMFNALRKHVADHFDGRDAHKDHEAFAKATDEMHDKIEKRFIDEIYDEEKMPLLDYELNINDGE